MMPLVCFWKDYKPEMNRNSGLRSITAAESGPLQEL